MDEPIRKIFHPRLQPSTIYIYIYIYSHYFLPIVPLPGPDKTYHNTPHLPLLPDWLVHSILPIVAHSYINTCYLPPGIPFTFLPKTLKMGQKSDPEMLVMDQKLMPGYNPKTFKQH
jgi:hypothetical protein